MNRAAAGASARRPSQPEHQSSAGVGLPDLSSPQREGLTLFLFSCGMFEAGASGYLLRDLNTAAMRQAVLDIGRDPSPPRTDHAGLRECRAHEPRAARESCPPN